jgi:hypothetical protein
MTDGDASHAETPAPVGTDCATRLIHRVLAVFGMAAANIARASGKWQ